MACEGHGEHGACVRCGTFICPACRRWLAEKPHCRECIERIGSKPSARATAAAAIATLGLGCLVVGPIAAILGALELRAIKAGAAPPAGESFAWVGLVLGAIEIVAVLVWGLSAIVVPP